MITAGNYDGQATKVQIGETENTGNLQIAIDMKLFQKDSNESPGSMTTLLVFTEKSAEYCFQRLRALGWTGTGADDFRKPIEGIFEKRVPCTVEAPQPYKDPRDGSPKMGVSKLSIDIGPGTVTLNKPLTADTFAARMKAMLGGGGGPSPAAGGGTPPGTPPPF